MLSDISMTAFFGRASADNEHVMFAIFVLFVIFVLLFGSTAAVQYAISFCLNGFRMVDTFLLTKFDQNKSSTRNPPNAGYTCPF